MGSTARVCTALPGWHLPKDGVSAAELQSWTLSAAPPACQRLSALLLLWSSYFSQNRVR